MLLCKSLAQWHNGRISNKAEADIEVSYYTALLTVKCLASDMRAARPAIGARAPCMTNGGIKFYDGLNILRSRSDVTPGLALRIPRMRHVSSYMKSLLYTDHCAIEEVEVSTMSQLPRYVSSQS